MMKHTLIRSAALDALLAAMTDNITFFDGRPARVTPEQLPAVAIYLSDAEMTENYLDGVLWQAHLHIELFLPPASTDSVLDSRMAQQIIPALKGVSALDDNTETFSAQGYDYRLDDEEKSWRSADLKYSFTYYQ